MLRSVAGWVLAFLAVPAGIGFLYLMRRSGALDIGPGVHGALPLQQLAGGDAQPLARVIVSWLAAGLVAGAAVAHVSRVRAVVGLIGLALLGALLLLAAGAGADTVAISDNLGPHLAPQLSRPGTWVAVALFVLGAAPNWWPARRWPRSRAAAASAR